MAMKIHLLLLSIFLGTAAIIGSIRQSELRQLRSQNESLRQQAAETRALAEKIVALEQVQVDLDELHRLLPMRNELARLRGEISLLNQAEQLIPEQAQSEVKSMLDQAQTSREQLELMRQMERNKKVGIEAERTLGELLIMARDFSRTRGQLPHSFQEMRSHRPGKQSPFERQHQFLGSVEDFFEFVLNGSNELLLREKKPRPHPDGGWVRLYGLPNFQVEEVRLPENNHDEWERSLPRP
jgi:hypothetical protein